MTFRGILDDFVPLRRRFKYATDRLVRLRRALKEESLPKDGMLTIFAAGSLGRRDAGRKSDLDMFVIADESGGALSNLERYQLFADLITLNRRLNYPEFSNDGAYLRIYPLGDLKTRAGSPTDDSENSFTARMLLLLESAAIHNPSFYERCVNELIDHYCRDEKGGRHFRPLFLLNDLLRFWRTLCLNYEQIRHDPRRPWRKKNVNLKFSRMLTVFGTVLPVIVRPAYTHTELGALCRLSPMQRLAKGLDNLNAHELEADFRRFLENYEYFLRLKEDDKIKDDVTRSIKAELDTRAEEFSRFLYVAVTHNKISPEYRKYLVI